MREQLHRQLRQEVDEMRNGKAKTDERANVAPRKPERQQLRRFEPVMPKDYVNSDQMRAELQARVAGAPKDESADLNPQQRWWNNN